MQPESCSRSKDKYILNVPIFNRACNPSKYKTDISSNRFIYWVSMTKTMMMATMAVWAGGQWIWNVPQTTVLERTMGALQHPNPLTLIGSLLRVEPTLSLFSLSLPLQLPLSLSCHPFTSTFTIIICVTWQKSCQLEVDLSRTRIWDPQLLLLSTILILDQCHHLCSMSRVNVSQKKLEFWIIRRSFVNWTLYSNSELLNISFLGEEVHGDSWRKVTFWYFLSSTNCNFMFPLKRQMSGGGHATFSSKFSFSQILWRTDIWFNMIKMIKNGSFSLERFTSSSMFPLCFYISPVCRS